jgi:hypothetical protein
MNHHAETFEKVRVHIDQHEHSSSNPTTGAALYLLGKLKDGYGLYREVDGDREDELVAHDPAPIHLKQDEHFHSARVHDKEFKIFVNTEPKEVDHNVLAFDEVTELAFPDLPRGPYIVFTVTYKKAAGPKHEGSLVPGGKVEVKTGTRFNVTRTDKS